MKNQEIRELTIQDLREHLKQETTKLDQLRMQHNVTPLDRPTEITNQRRLVARLRTILHEKEINESLKN